jgi:hypothetical protein
MGSRSNGPAARTAAGAFVVTAVLAFASASADWVDFVDQTAQRLAVASNLGAGDVSEKDYAWGDVDNDGDVDLVIVRKEPWTSTGKRPNLLLINDAGVLRDRTAQFATTTDVAGDQGFNTPTNDRDVVLVDVDLDGWLDIVTAVTLSDGDPRPVSHPRVYRNLGCTGDCNGTPDWSGFRYEFARIPLMLPESGQSGFSPRFCSVASGDLTGDGYPDLYFGDYDASGAGGEPQPPEADFNDRLLVNLGASNPGFFVDATAGSFSDEIQTPGGGFPFPVSHFGAADVIADMNGDSVPDIVKQTSLMAPIYVGIAYNDVSAPGSFDSYEAVNLFAPYFVSAGDLNNDEQLDLVVTDDGQDRYMQNTGTGQDGKADFFTRVFSFSHQGDGGASSDDGFGSNSVIADLNNDGWKDVLIADVDVDIPGCTRRMHLYRNLGSSGGGAVTLQEQTSGTDCESTSGHPASCIVASIGADRLRGVHDVAVFDLDADGWLDLVVGRCSGTEVYVNKPPEELVFSYPEGLPSVVPLGAPLEFEVQLTGSGGANPSGDGSLFYSIAGAAFTESPLVPLGNDRFRATIPAGAVCADRVRFYLAADSTQGETFTDPETAPVASYGALAALGAITTFEDDFEGDVSAWTVQSFDLFGGEWEQAGPVGTFVGPDAAAPDGDAQPESHAAMAFVTENGEPGADAAASDVDGGPTDLISPSIDLQGTDGIVSYRRWFYSDQAADLFAVHVRSNAGPWALVEVVPGGGATSLWQAGSFLVGDFVAPSSNVEVLFETFDIVSGSIVEAGVDLFRVETLICDNCADAAECDDQLFCNGAEQCEGALCTQGTPPCGLHCDEDADVCIGCNFDEQCNDGQFCNGIEFCVGANCDSTPAPCPGQLCDDSVDACVDCLVDADCADGVFCNGAETCLGGSCAAAPSPCVGAQACDEVNDVCEGVGELQPKMGEPLPGLTTEQLDRFLDGKIAFDKVFSVGEGLGPIFNQNSCGSCHNAPLGGSGSIQVTRFGSLDSKTEAFDPLVHLGGSLRQAQANSPECAEVVPPEANTVAQRVTGSTLGFGLVEAITDEDLQSLALNPPAGVSGTAHFVPVLELPFGATAVGRFGWKAQLATVRSFSADAALNEMGITNAILRDENPPNGDGALLARCDGVADPEDVQGPDGRTFVDRVTDFQRFLAPPPQTPRFGMSGEELFNDVGCNSCHRAIHQTPDDPRLEGALRDKVVRPYSDFLLHDMGLSADFIEQGDAGIREIRTPPLWGVRVRDPLWHDGRVAGGTLASRIRDPGGVIDQHGATGSEALGAAQAFEQLSAAEQDAVVAFLDSLGRAEFDLDADGLVGLDDWDDFVACYTGPGDHYTADDPCAVADADMDGDVDEDDFDDFVRSTSGPASGRVPDGGTTPGVPLTLSTAPSGDLSLLWGDSCLVEDSDYEVYEGTLGGGFTNHLPVLCSTGGLTEATVTPGSGATYYLVVPHNGEREGSYGADSSGAPRGRSVAGCLPAMPAACLP